MKKAAVIVCSIIYFLSIILVAFLGFQAEVANPTIYCDEIVYNYDCPHEAYGNGTVLYRVEKNNDYKEDLLGNNDEIVYKYRIHIVDYELLYNVFEGKMKLEFSPISHKKDVDGSALSPTTKTLSYSVSGDNAIIDSSYLTFTKFKSDGSIPLLIKSEDGTNKTIFTQIYW